VRDAFAGDQSQQIYHGSSALTGANRLWGNGAFTTALYPHPGTTTRQWPRPESWIVLLSPLKVFIPFDLPTAGGGSSHHNPVNSVTTISWPRDLAMYIKRRMRQRITDTEEQCNLLLLRQPRVSRRAKHPTNLEQGQLTGPLEALGGGSSRLYTTSARNTVLGGGVLGKSWTYRTVQ
jgi:hypothetical protein